MLWIAWGVVDYFFSCAFPIFLSVMILVLIGWIGIVVWDRLHLVMPVEGVRVGKPIKIP